jgi:hypothetical protein
MAVIQIQYDQEQMQNAATGAGPKLPEGWYVVTCRNFEAKAAKEAGKYPQLELQMHIDDSFNKANLGKDRKCWMSMSPKATPWRLIPYLKAAGIPYQDQGNGVISFDDAMLVGSRVKCTIEHKPGEQGTREEWGGFEPVGGQQAPQQFQTPGVWPGQAPQQSFAPPQQLAAQPGWPQQPQQGFAPQPPFQPSQPMQQPQAQPFQGQQFGQPGPFQPPQTNGNGQYQQPQQPAPANWPQGWPQPQQGR